MNRLDGLREFAKSLRRAPAGETSAQRSEREALREEAERVLDERADGRRKFDVLEDPRVLELRRRQRGNALTEREVRARLRREVEEAPPQSPALMALARSQEDRARELAWQDTDGPTEGWLNAS